ncbi:hypothetical protein RND81_06G104800 [Saponaria officinalis]|uniref:Uncharacterized protein n=1 Tax=Saponaria officinalis TaxID=3572 RepID=A0AAW1K8A2_SAPOF
MAGIPEVIDYEANSVRYGEDVFKESCFFDPREERFNCLSPGIVGYLKREGYLPREAEVFVPTEPIVTSSWTSPGWFCIHEVAFKTGFRISSPQIYQDTIRALEVSPNQLMPSCWKLLYGISRTCETYNIPFTVHDIMNNYYARWYGKGILIFRIRHNCPHLFYNLDSVDDQTWRDKFMFIKKSSLGEAGAFIPDFLSERGIFLFVTFVLCLIFLRVFCDFCLMACVVGNSWIAYQCEESNNRVRSPIEYVEEEKSWSDFAHMMFYSRVRMAPQPVRVGMRIAGLKAFQAGHDSVLGAFYSMQARIQMMRTTETERKGWDLASKVRLFKRLFPGEAIPGDPGIDYPRDFADSEEDEDPQSSILPPGLSDMEDYDEY